MFIFTVPEQRNIIEFLNNCFERERKRFLKAKIKRKHIGEKYKILKTYDALSDPYELWRILYLCGSELFLLQEFCETPEDRYWDTTRKDQLIDKGMMWSYLMKKILVLYENKRDRCDFEYIRKLILDLSKEIVNGNRSIQDDVYDLSPILAEALCYTLGLILGLFWMGYNSNLFDYVNSLRPKVRNEIVSIINRTTNEFGIPRPTIEQKIDESFSSVNFRSSTQTFRKSFSSPTISSKQRNHQTQQSSLERQVENLKGELSSKCQEFNLLNSKYESLRSSHDMMAMSQIQESMGKSGRKMMGATEVLSPERKDFAAENQELAYKIEYLEGQESKSKEKIRSLALKNQELLNEISILRSQLKDFEYWKEKAKRYQKNCTDLMHYKQENVKIIKENEKVQMDLSTLRLENESLRNSKYRKDGRQERLITQLRKDLTHYREKYEEIEKEKQKLLVELEETKLHQPIVQNETENPPWMSPVDELAFSGQDFASQMINSENEDKLRDFQSEQEKYFKKEKDALAEIQKILNSS